MKIKKGAIYIVLSAIFFSTYGIWSKMMAFQFNDFTQSWLRGIIVVLILAPIAFFTRSLKRIEREDIRWFLVVTIPGALVFPFYFIGFKYLSISTATLLFYSSLTITSFILGILFFKDKMNTIKIISLVTGILGLLIIFRISLSRGDLIPVIITILAGICGGIEVVFTKKISRKYHPIQLTLVLYFVDFIFNLALNVFISSEFKFAVDLNAWIALFSYAIAGLLSFTFVSLGYKNIEASVGALIGLLEIPFGILFGIILFNESLTWSIVYGSLLILIAASLNDIINMLRRRINNDFNL